MKKRILLLTLLIVTLLLTACGGEKKVTITFDPELSGMMFTEEEFIEIFSDLPEEYEIENNKDGSLSIEMTQASHDQMMEDLNAEYEFALVEMAAELMTIQEIQFNSDYTQLTIFADQEAYADSMDFFVLKFIPYVGILYQTLDGVQPDAIELILELKDSTSGEIFESYIFPEDLAELEGLGGF